MIPAAAEVFATRQRMGEAVIGQAHTLKTRALVKLGELLKDLPKAGPQYSKGGGSKGSKREPLLGAPATYADLGVTKKLASVAQQLAALPEATREAIAQREVTLSQAKREVKAADVTRQCMGEAVIGQAHALKVRALVKLGELLEALPKAKGGEHGGKSRIDGSHRRTSAYGLHPAATCRMPSLPIPRPAMKMEQSW